MLLEIFSYLTKKEYFSMKNNNTLNTSSNVIVQAISVLQKAFQEAASMFQDIDEMMEENGWQTAYGNRTTKEVTTHLNNPRNWLLQGSFRIYQNNKIIEANKMQTRLGVTIQWWDDNFPNQEPLLLIARFDATPDDFDHWDVRHAWEDAESTIIDGKPIKKRDDDWCFIVSARPLTSIKNKEMLRFLVKELIAYSQEVIP